MRRAHAYNISPKILQEQDDDAGGNPCWLMKFYKLHYFIFILLILCLIADKCSILLLLLLLLLLSILDNDILWGY